MKTLLFAAAILALPQIAFATNISLSPNTLDFGEVEVGETSAPQTIAVTNPGPNVYVMFDIEFPGISFNNSTTTCLSLEHPTLGFVITAGRTCEIDVSFTPPVAGAQSHDLVVTYAEAIGTTPGPQQSASVPLSGTGIQTPSPVECPRIERIQERIQVLSERGQLVEEKIEFIEMQLESEELKEKKRNRLMHKLVHLFEKKERIEGKIADRQSRIEELEANDCKRAQ